MFCKAKSAKNKLFLRGDFIPLPSKTVQFWDHLSPTLFPKDSESLKIWTSDSGKWGQNRPQNLVHEKGTNKETNNRPTSRLLDWIGPVGRFDENCYNGTIVVTVVTAGFNDVKGVVTYFSGTFLVLFQKVWNPITIEKNAKGLYIQMACKKNKPAAQAAGADPSLWSSTNGQNPPIQQNRRNFWTSIAIWMPFRT